MLLVRLVVELLGLQDLSLLLALGWPRAWRWRGLLLGLGLLLQHKLLSLLVDLVCPLGLRIHPAPLELHDELLLSLLLCPLTLLLVLLNFKPLALLVDSDLSMLSFFIVTIFPKNLSLRVDEVNAHVHKLLVVFSVTSIEPVLAIEEVVSF